jgi:hypothetical protein
LHFLLSYSLKGVVTEAVAAFLAALVPARAAVVLDSLSESKSTQRPPQHALRSCLQTLLQPPQWSALATVSTHCPPQHVAPGLPGAKHTAAADFLEQAYGDGELASRKRLLLVLACWRPAGRVPPASVTMPAVAAASINMSRTIAVSFAMVETGDY